jgi:hypothetical protein
MDHAAGDDAGGPPGGAGAAQGQAAGMELATAIRVVVRCRPVLPNETEAGKRMTSLTLDDANGSVSLLPKSEKDVGGGDKVATGPGGAVQLLNSVDP